MATYIIKDLTTNVEFECTDDTYILDAAENAGIDSPYSCRAGSCSSCVALRIWGKVDQSDASFLTEEQKQDFILLCSAYPLSNCVIRSGEESLFGGPEEEIRNRLNRDRSVPVGVTYWF
ncbi:2Fe-2S iron-sulfur cluster-binding protein [Pectobacterium wasabiae]|uniref:2Fe-2S iron-sulfur cluster-binding protein n=1 Tax=Pectobacterium wasabiae TaxID=55208 RepID=UPI00027B06C8|nr:2Fe-2S iron-sulfur cluster-binding protein [Pectobacterium wasabiae]EJS96120.1 PetF [Pectobacterium wasabiae CFBP 3304]